MTSRYDLRLRQRHRRRAILAGVGALAIVLLAFGSVFVVASSTADAGVPTCAGYPVDPLIRAAFPGDQDWALSVAGRESGCNPCAFYPGQSDCAAWNPGTAKGVFQLLGHDDLIHAACPFLYPLPWQVPECNIAAAALLYSGAGRSPWGG